MVCTQCVYFNIQNLSCFELRREQQPIKTNIDRPAVSPVLYCTILLKSNHGAHTHTTHEWVLHPPERRTTHSRRGVSLFVFLFCSAAADGNTPPAYPYDIYLSKTIPVFFLSIKKKSPKNAKM